MIARAIGPQLLKICVLSTAVVLTLSITALGHPVQSFAAVGHPLLELHQADFILSDSPKPPPDSAAWRPQALPDNWRVSHPGDSGSGWYRMQFNLPIAPDEFYAAYMPLLESSGALYVNGAFVGRIGAVAPVAPAMGRLAPSMPKAPPAFVGFPPRLVSIPPDLLRAGANTIYLQLWVKRGTRGALSTIAVGPRPAVRAAYQRRVLVVVTGPRIVIILSCVLGLFIGLLWMRRRRESTYGYAGLSAVAFALFVAGRFVISEPVLPFPYWDLAVRGTLECYIVLMCFFALRYGGWRRPRLERLLWGYVIVSPVLDGAALLGVGGWPIQEWWLMTFAVTVFYVAIFWIIAWQKKTVETLCLALAGSFKFVISANEYLLPYPIDLPHYQPYAYLPMFLVIGWMLVDRFARSLNEFEKLNAQLERRVADKHAELACTYERMQAMERNQAVVEERSRIMRDMHDGIGAQLISTLNLVEHGEYSGTDVAAALRECIDDLRLTIDSLEPTENDLLPVMGNLRYRLDERLRKQGIDLDWQVSEVPEISCLTPQNVLHVLRILQEAFSNIIKHAHATGIHVETGLDATGKHIYIQVRDNGVGFCGQRTGRGIASMKHRANLIGGRLDIQSSAAGTTLNLLLPVS
ncbi:sensor histidine kinase [Trinickia symbiotica]|nr:ATP-binding protein [Trinickia symbiotica]